MRPCYRPLPGWTCAIQEDPGEKLRLRDEGRIGGLVDGTPSSEVLRTSLSFCARIDVPFPKAGFTGGQLPSLSSPWPRLDKDTRFLTPAVPGKEQAH